MTKAGVVSACVFLTCCLLSCELVGNVGGAPEPLQFDEMHVRYKKFGGFIHTSTLVIEPTGTATAGLIGHGSGEVLTRSTIVLNDDEREQLARLLAWFPTYSRAYHPETYYTDQNTHEIVLRYGDSTDSVSVYHPSHANMPPSLGMKLDALETIHARALSDQS